MNNQFIKSVFIAFMLSTTLCDISAPAKKAVKETTQIVYVCTGPKAYTYHKSSDCSGLNNCSGSVISVSLSKAKQMGRRPCKKCY